MKSNTRQTFIIHRGGVAICSSVSIQIDMNNESEPLTAPDWIWNSFSCILPAFEK